MLLWLGVYDTGNEIMLPDHNLWHLRRRDRRGCQVVKLQVNVVDHLRPFSRFTVQTPTSFSNEYIALFRSVGIWDMSSSAGSGEVQPWNKASEVSQTPGVALWDGSAGSRVNRFSIANRLSTCVHESAEPLPSPLRDPKND